MYTQSQIDREKSIAIIKEMVELGYCLFDETPEHFVDRLNFTPDIFEGWLDKYRKLKNVE